jgi:hypothetical protein
VNVNVNDLPHRNVRAARVTISKIVYVHVHVAGN